MTDFPVDTYASVTYKVRTPLGHLYVRIARVDGRIKRIMAQCGKEATGGRWCGIEKEERVSHPQINSLLDALLHFAKRLIEAGVEERKVAGMLMGYDEGWPMGYYFPADKRGDIYKVRSLQDALGKVIVHDAEMRKHPPV